MSFRAVINDPEKHNVWFRAVSILSLIDENIRITITSDEVIIWAVNCTFTSLSQIKFSRKFFYEFDFKPHEIIFGDNGLQIVTDLHGNDHKLYSFQINAKHLTTVSKKPDTGTVQKFMIAVNNTTTCPEALANRLLVSVELDSLISKEYSPYFDPIKYDPIVINLKYKKKFVDVFGSSARTDKPGAQLDPNLIEIFQNAEHELSTALFNEDVKSEIRQKDQLTTADEINFICCDHALVRNFIENCNVNVTDEMELKIDTKKMTLTAFTKAVYNKNGGLLKNAMSIANTFGTRDLEHYCLFTIVEQNNENKPTKESHKRLVFKSKDFKNFISMGSAWKNLQGNTSNNISIWFCNPGDPILMEMSKEGVKVELVEVTDSTTFSSLSNDISVGKDVSNTNKSNLTFKDGKRDQVSSSGRELFLSPLKRTSALQNNTTVIKDSRISPLKQSMDSLFSKEGSTSPKRSLDPRKLFVRSNSEESTQQNNDNDDLDLHHGNHADSLKNDNETVHTNDRLENNHVNNIQQLERNQTTVGWGKRTASELNETDTSETAQDNDQRSVLKREKQKYMKRNKQNDTQEDNGLGPTQPSVPKGLFD